MNKLPAVFAWGVAIFVTIVSPAQAATLLVASGEVRLNGKTALAGAAVSAGDIVSTGPLSLALVELDDKSRLKLDSSSAVRIGEKTQSADLHRGGVIAKIRKATAGRRNFFIRTRSAVLGVRGTEFYTALHEGSGSLWMCVNEGQVEIRNPEAKSGVLVPAGKGVRQGRDGRITPPRFFEWTRSINWQMDGAGKELINRPPLEQISYDPLSRDYE